MRDRGAHTQGSTRIHAVILTRDRAQVLERCVDTALSTLNADDTLTVLDDSCAMTARVNAALLAEAARRSTAHLTHLRAEQLHDAMAHATGGSRAVWQSKTAPRDIAPLRNLSLLISAAVGARTTVLVDDDICSFDLDATHSALDAFDRESGGVVVGAKIGGLTEQDTVTRLWDAIRCVESKTHDCFVPAEELFRVPPGGDPGAVDAAGWVSAGYMAFRLPPTRLFAFPPGYNEDWLWCLLHDACGDTRIVPADQMVMHEPPCLRRSTRDDVLFEMAGDLILDCLEERRSGNSSGPDSALEDLANHAPAVFLMPSARAKAVLERAQCLSEKGHLRALPELQSYGLSVLGDILRSCELDMDGSARLSAWSSDAAAKHKSFAATLGNATAQATVGAMLQEGKL